MEQIGVEVAKCRASRPNMVCGRVCKLPVIINTRYSSSKQKFVEAVLENYLTLVKRYNNKLTQAYCHPSLSLRV